MDFFISPENIPASAVKGVYDYYLVILSFVIAVVAAYVSLGITRSGIFEQKAIRSITLSALVMGTGIWSAHFTGILAYNLEMEHTYNPLRTALSMVIAAVFSWAVFYNISKPQQSKIRVMLNALLMGIGIAGMYYMGMFAMQMRGEIRYTPYLFWLSILIAVIASVAAMLIIKRIAGVTRKGRILEIMAAIILGLAVCGMHYTGMAAAVFIPYADCRVGIEQNHTVLALCITMATFTIIFLSLFLFDYEKVSSGKLSIWGSTLFMFILCSAIVLYVTISSESAYDLAKKQYQRQAHSDSISLLHSIENSYIQIYQGLRTIAQLQSVRSIDRYARTLSDNDRLAIKEMYENLNSRVNLSEINVLPSDFNPEKLDPVTGRLEEPILWFENHNEGEMSTGPMPENDTAEHESSEYQVMAEHVTWFSKHYPDRSKISKLDFPAISSGKILTSDRTLVNQGERTDDQATSGFVYSVPFYDMSGNLRGIISAVKLSDSIKDYLIKPHYALVKLAHDYVVFPKSDGQAHISEKFVRDGKADPSLIYSEVIPLAVPDHSGQWGLWVGLPNHMFELSEDVSNIRHQRIFGYFAAAALGFVWVAFFILMRRRYIDETRRLSSAKEIAEKADRAKSDFLANMTHELRTPLNSIVGVSHLLAERGLEKEERSMLDIVIQSSHLLLSHVNEILDISKIEAGETKLEQIGFNFAEVLEKIDTSNRINALQKQLVFECNAESGIPFLVGDPFRLTQIITNIISNAIKYTDKGSVKASFFYSPSGAGKVILHGRVTDTGIGIPEDKIAGIFNKFSQVDASNARRYGGTGLGLAISKDLVELMGGQIGVESEIGKGTSFWFRIPFTVTGTVDDSYEGVSAGSEAEICDLLNPSTTKILVAEDHPLNQEYIKLLLDKLGFKDVDMMDNGLDVLKAIESKQYDLVLIDCFMPELNGYDTARAIRQKERGTSKHIPIVALTANAIAGEDEKCRLSGMDDYVPKPVSEALFIKVLSRWIRFAEIVQMGGSEKTERRKSLPVDLETLRTFTNGNLEIEKKLIGIFLSESAKNISALKNNCFDGYSLEWVEAAHSLKGGAVGVGAESLRAISAVAQSMENVSIMERSIILSKINAEYEVVREYLSQKG